MNKIKFKKKLVIGSANFTQKYGADTIKINRNEIKKISYFALKNNINKIDTADSYLNNKNFLFKKMDKKFNITTKIKPNNKWVSLNFCEKKIEEHFKKFNNNKIETLLFHDVDILFTRIGCKIFENLEILKKKKYFKNLGLSIYNTKCLDYIISNFNIDVIQCPYNILDKRIIYSGWFSRLQKKGIEVHVRSIFLQGLLVNEVVYKKKYFNKWQKQFFEWFQDLKKKDISPIDYCLSDLLTYDFDRIIIGINNCDNLKHIINFKNIKNRDKIFNLKINDLKLIDPRNWR
jgi:aryl-alcohol dehydrogenase-like predicted oxidoreductase